MAECLEGACLVLYTWAKLPKQGGTILFFLIKVLATAQDMRGPSSSCQWLSMPPAVGACDLACWTAREALWRDHSYESHQWSPVGLPRMHKASGALWNPAQLLCSSLPFPALLLYLCGQPTLTCPPSYIKPRTITFCWGPNSQDGDAPTPGSSSTLIVLKWAILDPLFHWLHRLQH